MENKEIIGLLACMINSVKEHITLLTEIGLPVKQALNYKDGLEMQLSLYKNIDSESNVLHNYYNEDK